jgi:hypothetical protein
VPEPLVPVDPPPPDAPPPVGAVAPPEVEPPAPPEAEPDPPEAEAPPDEDTDPPEEAEAPDDVPPADPLAVVELVVDALVTCAAAVEVGTVSGGAPEISAELDPPPPQAPRPKASATAAPREDSQRRVPITELKSRVDPCACRSVDSRSDPFGRADRTNCKSGGFRLPTAVRTEWGRGEGAQRLLRAPRRFHGPCTPGRARPRSRPRGPWRVSASGTSGGSSSGAMLPAGPEAPGPAGAVWPRRLTPSPCRSLG